MAGEPYISVCLPVYNGIRFLQERMESILNQSFSRWELVVCDSYSNDGTWEYLKRYEQDQRVRLFQVPRAGIYAGWNDCLRRSRGKYITIATADDTAHPRFLERMIAALDHNPEVHLAMCQFDFITEHGGIVSDPAGERPNDCFGEWQARLHRRSGKAEFLAHLIRGGSWTTITSVVFTRELLEKVGLFLEGETSVVDQLWASKAALLTDSIWIPERLATWRIHGGQGSSRWNRRSGWRQVQLTARTICECEPLIPELWKRDPKWREKLMWGAWHFYRSCYGLNRKTLCRQFGKFLVDAGWGLWHEPVYVLKRLVEGLSWGADEYGDSSEYVHKLIQEWKVPWPPEPVNLREGNDLCVF